MIELEANNINESIFGKIKDFFKKNSFNASVRQATEKEKEEDDYDRYYDDIYGEHDTQSDDTVNRWKKDPDNAVVEIIKEISEDFNRAPYSDKISITINPNDSKYEYRFEDGHKITITIANDRQLGRPVLILLYHKYNVSIKISTSVHNSVVKFLNKITEKGVKRPQKKQQSYNRYTGQPTKTETIKPKSKDPKKDTYDKLKATYKLRKEHLDKMKPNDPEKATAQNELDSLSATIKKMKAKHQFEHLKSFENFNI